MAFEGSESRDGIIPTLFGFMKLRWPQETPGDPCGPGGAVMGCCEGIAPLCGAGCCCGAGCWAWGCGGAVIGWMGGRCIGSGGRAGACGGCVVGPGMACVCTGFAPELAPPVIPPSNLSKSAVLGGAVTV